MIIGNNDDVGDVVWLGASIKGTTDRLLVLIAEPVTNADRRMGLITLSPSREIIGIGEEVGEPVQTALSSAGVVYERYPRSVLVPE